MRKTVISLALVIASVAAVAIGFLGWTFFVAMSFNLAQALGWITK